jgi:hypothetical protein
MNERPQNSPGTPDRCCWHYIRPSTAHEYTLDGPIGNVCTIDRKPGVYHLSDELNLGDKYTAPEDSCEQFEVNLPPTGAGRQPDSRQP